MENKIIIIGANSKIAQKLIRHLYGRFNIISFSRKKLKTKRIKQYVGNYNNLSIINNLKKNI